MKIQGIFSGEKLLVLGLIILMQVLSYLPIARNYLVAPPDRYYFGQGDYPIDMLGNLTIIRDGFLGHWGRINKITSWYQKIPWNFKFEYVLIGQTARLLKIDPLVMYRLAVLIISSTTMVLYYFLLTKIFSKKSDRIIAFLLTLFACGIYFPGNDWKAFPMALKALGNTTVFQQFTAAPHYLLGHIFSLSSLFFLAKVLTRPHKIRYLILMIIFSFLTTIVFAPTMFLILLSIPVFIIFKALLTLRTHGKITILGTLLFILLLYILAALIPIGYIRFLQTSIADAERVIRINLSIGQYLFAVGLVFPLAVLSFPAVLKAKNNLLLLFFSFLIAHPLAVYLVQEFNLFSSRRLFQTPYIFIFAILATFGINTIYKAINSLKLRISLRLIQIILILVIFISGIFSYELSIEQSTACFCITYPYPYGYPEKEVMEGIWWLRDNTKEENTVLSGLNAGLIIPAFAGNKVYISWWMELAKPPEYPNTEDTMFKFYKGKMNPQEAREFLIKNKIDYVFFGDEEKFQAAGKDLSFYPFLQKVFQKGDAVVYTVSRS